MKRVLAFCLVIAVFISVCPCVYADGGLLDEIIDYVQDGRDFKLRDSLSWGMSLDEVVIALKKEERDGQKMCHDIKSDRLLLNKTLGYVTARAIVGNYEPGMYCLVSDLWGLYAVLYDFSSKNYMPAEEYEKWTEITDDQLYDRYEEIEQTMNYVYGMSGRVIDKWETRDEVQDSYYIIRTSWSVGLTSIYLGCYKENNVYQLRILYESPDYDEYETILDQDLYVTGEDMFYGY